MGAARRRRSRCLNFGSPERAENVKFSECIRGISDACNELGTPVAPASIVIQRDEGNAIYPTRPREVGLLEEETIGPTAISDANLESFCSGNRTSSAGGMAAENCATRCRAAGVRWTRAFAVVAILDESKCCEARMICERGLASRAECSMNGIGCHVEFAGTGDCDASLCLLKLKRGGRPHAETNIRRGARRANESE